MESRKIKHFEIDNRIEEISSLALKLEKLAKDWKLPPELTMNINLVVEEALSNIIFYAFKSEEKHKIKIDISLQKNEILMKFKDSGFEFNPLNQTAPDIELPAEERPIGGLGIFLISQIMDEMNYKRQNNQNVLTLKKSI